MQTGGKVMATWFTKRSTNKVVGFRANKLHQLVGHSLNGRKMQRIYQQRPQKENGESDATRKGKLCGQDKRGGENSLKKKESAI